MIDPERIQESFDVRQDERRVQRIWRRIEARRSEASVPMRTSRPLLLGFAVAAGCAVAFGLSSLVTPGRTLVSSSGEHIPATIYADTQGRDLELPDGSRVSLARGTRMELIEESPRRVSLALRMGFVSFETETTDVAYTVDCGTVALAFSDAAFSVERGASEVVIHVLRGAVVLRGESVPDRVQRVVGGQTMRVALHEMAHAAPTPAAAVEIPEVAAEQVEAEAVGVIEPVAARVVRGPAPAPAIAEAAEPSSWQSAAESGNYREAYEALGPSGVQRELVLADRVDDLFTLADVARLSGHPALAIAPLRRILDRHSDDPRAALAAFTMAQLELDRLGHPTEAAVAYARSLELGLPRSMRELAVARRVEALGRAGSPDAAAAASSYLRAYPAGRYRDEVMRWLAP